MYKVFRLLVVLALAIGAAFCLAACNDTSTTTASCAFVVGNGSDSNDAKLHYIEYPGQTFEPNNEDVTYVPCNSRNYIINNGTVKNANGQIVGDRNTPILATTSSGVKIAIQARALWTLNESPKAMADFYNVCFKYTCASNDDTGGTANFSTPGWNGMLAENFGTAMDTVGREAAKQVNDSIWKQQDPKQYKALGDKMSALFANAMRANLGYREDLFCGSGNSTWQDPNNPGKGTFICNTVRIIVDDVQAVPNQGDQNSAGAVTLNQQRLRNAQALYGPDAGFWLGVQDSVSDCKAAATTCVFNIGGTSSASAVPVLTPVKK